MADTITFPRSLDDVRTQVERIRTEGEKLVDRLRADAKDLIARAPKVASLDEARKRAEQAVKAVQDLQARRAELVQDLRTRRSEFVSRLVEEVIRAFGLARASRIADLDTRLTALEARVASLAKPEERAA
jgi:hypothetical protein